MREDWEMGVNPKKAYNAEKTIVRRALKQADFTDIKKIFKWTLLL